MAFSDMDAAADGVLTRESLAKGIEEGSGLEQWRCVGVGGFGFWRHRQKIRYKHTHLLGGRADLICLVLGSDKKILQYFVYFWMIFSHLHWTWAWHPLIPEKELRLSNSSYPSKANPGTDSVVWLKYIHEAFHEIGQFYVVSWWMFTNWVSSRL